MTKASGYFQYYNAAERAPKYLGLDISTYQYPMNFVTAFSKGARFIVNKCSRGAGFVDPDFTAAHILAQRNAGLLVGAYHYSQPSVTGYTTANAITEADWFITKMAAVFGTGLYGDIMPSLDFEDPAAVWANNDTAYNWIEAFVNRVKSITGRQCQLYTYYYYVEPLSTIHNQLIHSTKGGIYQVAPLWLSAKAPDIVAYQPPSAYPEYNFISFGGYPTELWLNWQYSTDLNAKGSYFGASSADIDTDILETDKYSIMPPGRPLNLIATPSDTKVLLEWNLLPDTTIVNYNIYKDNVLLATIGPSQNSYMAIGLTNLTNYKFNIEAVNAWEKGPQSYSQYAMPRVHISRVLAGKNAKVNAYGSEIIITAEPTTSTDNQNYQVTTAAHRVLSRTTTIVVKNAGVPTTEVYTLDRLSGRVSFTTSTARTITIDGGYLPLVLVTSAHEYNYSLGGKNEDSTIFGNQFVDRTQGIKDIEGSISKFYDTSNYFYNKLITDINFVIEFYADSSGAADIRAWAKIKKANPSAKVDGLVDESIDFEGNGDQDKRCVSFGPF